VVVFLLGIFAMVAGGTLLKTNFEYLSSEMLNYLVTLIGTLPWLLCLGWLAYHTREMPLGWKGLWFVATFTAIIPGFLGFACDSTNRTMSVSWLSRLVVSF
jgi:hypothetical protein